MGDIGKNILIAAISAFFSFLVTFYFYLDQREISKLDFNVSNEESYFSQSNFPTDKFSLKFDNERIDKLSLLKVSLLNFSTKDFTDLPINIKITPKDKSNFKILDYSFVGQSKIKNLVQITSPQNFDGTSYNYGFQISALNRVEKPEYGFQMIVAFTGEQAPVVDVVCKGVGVRPFDINNSPYQKSTNIKTMFWGIGIVLGMFAIMFIAMMLILSPLISYITRKIEIRRSKSYAKELFSASKENDLLPEHTDEQLSELITIMLYKRQLSWWNKKNPFGKWALGLISPQKSDYEIDI